MVCMSIGICASKKKQHPRVAQYCSLYWDVFLLGVRGHMISYALRKPNSSPLKIGLPTRKTRLPTRFRGYVSFREEGSLELLQTVSPTPLIHINIFNMLKSP